MKHQFINVSHLKVTFVNRVKEETIDDYLIQVQILLEIFSYYQVDHLMPHKLEPKYWAFLGQQILESTHEVIDLLMKGNKEFGVQLVPNENLNKIYKCISVLKFSRYDYFMPGLLDSHIEETAKEIFIKMGKPILKRKASEVLKNMLSSRKTKPESKPEPRLKVVFGDVVFPLKGEHKKKVD